MKVFQVCYVFFKQMKALWCHWRCWKIRCDGWIWQENGPGDVPCHKGVHEHWTIDRVLDCQRSRSRAGCKFVSIEWNSYNQTSGRVCWRLQRYWPVAQPHRRPKLELELEKLMADYTIKKVHKPISWVSPVEITLKRFVNEIRLNVEMKEANKAIPCAYTVMLTLDDIIHNSMVPPCFRTWTWTMAITSWN